jgi:hypothetical protein
MAAFSTFLGLLKWKMDGKWKMENAHRMGHRSWDPFLLMNPTHKD